MRSATCCFAVKVIHNHRRIDIHWQGISDIHTAASLVDDTEAAVRIRTGCSGAGCHMCEGTRPQAKRCQAVQLQHPGDRVYFGQNLQTAPAKQRTELLRLLGFYFLPTQHKRRAATIVRPVTKAAATNASTVDMTRHGPANRKRNVPNLIAHRLALATHERGRDNLNWRRRPNTWWNNP